MCWLITTVTWRSGSDADCTFDLRRRLSLIPGTLPIFEHVPATADWVRLAGL